MKACQVCSYVDGAGDAKTCPMCGEASWHDVPDVVVDVPLKRPDAVPQSKRSGR